MARYEVTVSRTETITFAVNADNPEDAEDRYLMYGDEVASATTELSVERIELTHPL